MSEIKFRGKSKNGNLYNNKEKSGGGSMSREERIKALEDFKNNKVQKYKLDQRYCGHWKVGSLDKILDETEKAEREFDKNSVDKGEKMNFGKAIQLLKEGKKLQRQGWNGKGQYIELATCVSYVNADGIAVNAEHKAIGNCAIAFVGTSGIQLGWLASQSDMLANDWVEYIERK